MQGKSILFASGDQGVCGREGCDPEFNPDFPGASPYVTAVGGTNFERDGVVGQEEAWSGSGGGFSNTFGIPKWQKKAVAAYKKKAKLPPQNLWNNTGRGYPDVAALGGGTNPYCVATGGFLTGVYGTSASSPVTAGVFALLNGLRLASGKKPLGYLNPFIYQYGSLFNDVTEGENNYDGEYGFKAIAGWDPATGWGSPDYSKLSVAVLEI